MPAHGSIIFARSRRRGFSFTEILFAVIVLGIGFIMIAAIFPVAIQQGKLTSEESTATGVAREALSYLGQVGSNTDETPNSQGGPLFPATGSVGSAAPHFGLVYSFRDPQPSGAIAMNTVQNPSNDPLLAPAVAGRQADALWNRLNLSLIVPSDQRFAFVGLYRRNGDPTDRKTWSPYVQAWFIPVTARSRSIYSPGTPTTPGDVYGNSVNLQARLVKVSIDLDPLNTYSTTARGGYVLYNWSGAVVPSTYQSNAISDNCYVIIANDQNSLPVIPGAPPSYPNAGRLNGHVYHVGLRRPDLDASTASGAVAAYNLVPNGDFTPDAGADGVLGTNDDILTCGMTQSGSGTTPNPTFTGSSPYGDANGPADAYVVGVDTSGAEAGSSQDISAFTTFVKVN